METSGQPGPRAVISSGVHEVHELEELESAIDGGRYSNEQLERGAFRSRLVRIRMRESTLDSGLYYPRLRARGGMPPDAFTLGYFAKVPGEAFLQGRKFTSARAAIIRPGDTLDSIAPAGLHWFAMTVPVESLGRRLEALGHDPARFEAADSGLLPENPETARLGSLLAQVYRRSLRPGPIASDDDLQEQLVLAFVDGMSVPTRAGKNAAGHDHQIARRGEDWMRGQLEQPLSVAALCRHCGCSRRSVEYAYRRVFGMGPAAYFRSLRLHRAHERLRKHDAADTTVTRIATDLGFEQLGRFSVEYRKTFGESPRDSLRRSRRVRSR